ncbi:NAD(P)/FAD-dependent oxidoreductase [Amycolatopsis sp. CA-230715]|uniref:NAD(P)/FAD-dependent oxidoreductase n=1 Tax=Amycolatopsis sp. CA-230715 TaxID=2745196 RepID=UPI001C0183A9|nr:FAD-dependent oxidoreductase [Amycolatopsis sp. CA-230715]QWF84834.1 Gamma-glutamylputrescine oxidoreductase [Amycolatopsis sp. CA-230715]
MSTTPYWQETLAPVVPGPPLDGDATCDVCIVGGGATGLWTAHALKEAEPSMDVRIVEAGTVGLGASVHGGGFVTLAGAKVLRRLLWYYGTTKAAGVYKAVAKSMLEIGRFCRKNGIDAEYERTGVLQVVTDTKQLARLQLQVNRARKLGMDGSMTVYDAEEARERIGSPTVLGGMTAFGAVVNPHKLVQGLAGVVRAQGTVIHEQTPATEIRKIDGRFQVTTPHGVVTAREVVLATNAWQHTFPEMTDRVMPVWNHLLVSEPLTEDQLARVPWPGREPVSNMRSFFFTTRLTPDNRVIWTGGRWYYRPSRDMAPDHVRNAEAYRELRQAFDEFFPDWRDVRMSHANGACIGWSHSFIPQFGRTSSGLLYGHGYTGAGIAASHAGGRILRDLILHRASEYTELAYVTVNQPKFMPGKLGDRGADFFVWRQRTGDRIPLLLPHRAALSSRSFFNRHRRVS